MAQEEHTTTIDGHDPQYRYYLTTLDNPFDPVDDPDAWLLFDKLHHYNCNELVARFARTSDELSDSENQKEIRHAIARFIALEPTNNYIMLMKPMPKAL